MEAGRAYQEALEVTQMIDVEDETMEWEYRNQVGPPGGFDVRAHIKNELLDGWWHYKDKKS